MTEYNLRQINNSNTFTAFLWDWDNINIRLDIEDGVLIRTPEKVYLMAVCTGGRGFKLKEDYKWEWKKGDTRELILSFWQIEHEETDYKTKEKKKLQPDRCELFMGYLADLYEGLPFSGCLSLNSTSQLDIIISGKREDGSDLPDELRSMLGKSIGDFRIKDDPELSKFTKERCTELLGLMGSTKKTSYTSASKGQTEYEKLKDREKFLLEVLNKAHKLELESIRQLIPSAGLLNTIPGLDVDIDFLEKFIK